VRVVWHPRITCLAEKEAVLTADSCAYCSAFDYKITATTRYQELLCSIVIRF